MDLQDGDIGLERVAGQCEVERERSTVGPEGPM